MAWFKSKEQKQKEELEAAEARAKALKKQLEADEKEKQETHYNEILSRVIITPESLESYQRRMGYTVEVIDTGEMNKGVTFLFNKDLVHTDPHTSEQVKKRLVESGIEAVVEANYFMSSKTIVQEGWGATEINSYIYGLPVARKKSQGPPYR